MPCLLKHNTLFHVIPVHLAVNELHFNRLVPHSRGMLWSQSLVCMESVYLALWLQWLETIASRGWHLHDVYLWKMKQWVESLKSQWECLLCLVTSLNVLISETSKVVPFIRLGKKKKGENTSAPQSSSGLDLKDKLLPQQMCALKITVLIVIRVELVKQCPKHFVFIWGSSNTCR